jgi:hypothetical protein
VKAEQAEDARQAAAEEAAESTGLESIAEGSGEETSILTLTQDKIGHDH